MGRRLENSEKSVRNFEGEEADEEAKETEKKKEESKFQKSLLHRAKIENTQDSWRGKSLREFFIYCSTYKNALLSFTYLQKRVGTRLDSRVEIARFVTR